MTVPWRTGWLAVAAALLGFPLGVLVGVLATEERLIGVGEAVAPRIEPAQTVEYDERTGVAATLSWAESPALYAPDWSGTVGDVLLQSGQVLRSGDRVATISGVDRITVASEQPFYRRLAVGDRGRDVSWLHGMLADLGYLATQPSDDMVVGAATMMAIAALAADLGDEQAVPFDPGWFVWLPSTEFTVATVEVSRGAPAPPQGTVIADGPPALQDVTLQPLQGGRITLDFDVQYVLELAGERLPLDSRTAKLDGTSLARLGGLLPPLVDSAPGTVLRAQPISVWAIPASAVMSAPEGNLCIRKAEQGRYFAVPVDVLAGRAGVAFIRPLPGTVEVLHNPAQLLSEPSCPSI